MRIAANAKCAPKANFPQRRFSLPINCRHLIDEAQLALGSSTIQNQLQVQWSNTTSLASALSMHRSQRSELVPYRVPVSIQADSIELVQAKVRNPHRRFADPVSH